MKIHLTVTVNYECDVCGVVRIVNEHDGLDEIDAQERALRATARAGADELSGNPPSAWVLENVPPGWTALVRRASGPDRKVLTALACSPGCVVRHLSIDLSQLM